MTRLFGLSRSTFYRNRKLKPLSLTSVEERIHQLVQENHFLFGYRKIHALLSRELVIGINKVARIMKHRGWNCIAKIKKYRHTGPQHKAFDNLIQKNWNAKRPLQKLTTDITYLPFGEVVCFIHQRLWTCLTVKSLRTRYLHILIPI
ncbi:IS3 family transposase [Enterococcus thailandicus]|uniref:IS3 family transposase n=1 Tax=Enterococcus thailandicus TaxID=417368 RepID=UPI00351D7262